MNPTDVKSVIDTASQQSDRWLFVALLVIGMLAIYMLAKYFTGQISSLAAKHDELNKFVRDEHSQLVAKCTSALEENTKALEHIREMRATFSLANKKERES